MSLEEKKLLAIQQLASIENEALLNSILKQIEDEDAALPASMLQLVSDRADADIEAGKVVTSEQLLRNIASRNK